MQGHFGQRINYSNAESQVSQDQWSSGLQMSRLVGKPTMWFLNRSDTNRSVQSQKRARILKFRI